MILYFSATGNSKYCAEKIAKATGDSIFSLNDAMKKGLTEIDCSNCSQLGFVLPTHDWGLPWAVEDYLKVVKLRNLPTDTYIFSVHTCGMMSGANGYRMKGIMSKKGLHLDAGFSIFMPTSDFVMKQKGGPEKKAEVLTKAEQTISDIITDVKSRNRVFRLKNQIPFPVQLVASKLSLPIRKKVKDFHVTEACIGCGKCKIVCPQNIIDMKEHHPIWTVDRCMNCFACMHNCPKQAIQHEKSAKKRT